MKSPLKYTIYCILYTLGEKGIWEYELYEILKTSYPHNSLIKLREMLTELKTKNWTEEIDVKLYGDEVIRKYKLRPVHNQFVEYMIDSKKIIADAGIDLSLYM